MADTLLRCLSGTNAISTYELEALPLSATAGLGRLEALVVRGADHDESEAVCVRLYGLPASCRFN